MNRRSLVPADHLRGAPVHRLAVFHDERLMGNDWLYHGFVIVPTDMLDQITRTLIKDREAAGCIARAIHFSDLTAHSTTSSRTGTALRWAEYYRRGLFKLAYHSVLGVALDRVIWSRFGEPSASRSERKHRVYNRFFEIGLFGALRFFFAEHSQVVLERIYSHKRNLESADPFLTYPGYKISLRDSNITVAAPEITHVAGDAAQETGSPELVDLIQVSDVLLGSHSHNLDAAAKSKTGCDEVADVIMPITERLTRHPFNTNSQYWKRYTLSFFPREQVDDSQFEVWPWQSLFYHNRPIRRQPRNQMTLF